MNMPKKLTVLLVLLSLTIGLVITWRHYENKQWPEYLYANSYQQNQENEKNINSPVLSRFLSETEQDKLEQKTEQKPMEIGSTTNNQETITGQIDDNQQFKDYQKYTKNTKKGDAYDLDISQRYKIIVQNQFEKGVLGQEIFISDNLQNQYIVRSDSDGIIYFYPAVYNPQAEKIELDTKCQGKNLNKKISLTNYLKGDLLHSSASEKCTELFRGYYFDQELKTCISESTAACKNPYYFNSKEECENLCLKFHNSQKPQEFDVQVNGKKYHFNSQEKEWNIEVISALEEKPLHLDFALTIDTTDSMSAQIEELKNNMPQIVKQIEQSATKAQARYALILYRDRSDQYLTRIYDFTSDFDEFQEILNSIETSGGGDFEEDLNTALADSLERLSWNTEQNSIKMNFLIADAPPHMDYEQNYDYKIAMLRALELGIKIFPLSSNSDTEFIARQIALISNAKYIFLDEKNTLTTAIQSLIQNELSQVK